MNTGNDFRYNSFTFHTFDEQKLKDAVKLLNSAATNAYGKYELSIEGGELKIYTVRHEYKVEKIREVLS